MARKRRRKGPSGADFIPPIAILTAAYLLFNGFALVQVIWLFALIIAVVVLIAIAFWFLRRLYKQGQTNAGLTTNSGKLNSSEPSHRTPPTLLSNGEFETPSQWTEHLISELDWRVFEKLCMRLWEEKGFVVRETELGADGGVDFYLYAKSTKKKIGAVQCKSWNTRQIDVKVVRELQGVVAAEQLKLGLLMYSGELTKAAKVFIRKPSVTVRTQGNQNLLKEINKLPTQTQTRLLNELINKDYQIPSCPNCDIKLVERHTKRTGDFFWGCANFPRCRYTLNVQQRADS